MLDLLYLLVKYGYYANLKDINALIPSLVSLLDGKNDKPFPEANNDQSMPFREVKMVVYTYIPLIVNNYSDSDLRTISKMELLLI